MGLGSVGSWDWDSLITSTRTLLVILSRAMPFWYITLNCFRKEAVRGPVQSCAYQSVHHKDMNHGTPCDISFEPYEYSEVTTMVRVEPVS